MKFRTARATAAQSDADMMMESVDEGTKVAQQIRKKDTKVPIYLLSSIGSAWSYSSSVKSSSSETPPSSSSRGRRMDSS